MPSPVNGWPTFVPPTAEASAAPAAEPQKGLPRCDTAAPEERPRRGTAYCRSLSILTPVRARLGGLTAVSAARRGLGEADGWSMEVVVAWRVKPPTADRQFQQQHGLRLCMPPMQQCACARCLASLLAECSPTCRRAGSASISWMQQSAASIRAVPAVIAGTAGTVRQQSGAVRSPAAAGAAVSAARQVLRRVLVGSSMECDIA